MTTLLITLISASYHPLALAQLACLNKSLLGLNGAVSARVAVSKAGGNGVLGGSIGALEAPRAPGGGETHRANWKRRSQRLEDRLRPLGSQGSLMSKGRPGMEPEEPDWRSPS